MILQDQCRNCTTTQSSCASMVLLVIEAGWRPARRRRGHAGGGAPARADQPAGAPGAPQVRRYMPFLEGSRKLTSRAASARPHHATGAQSAGPCSLPLLQRLCVMRCVQPEHPNPCGAGIATSLKVLFSADDCSGNPANGPQLVLERNEVIALVNLLERLSNSIEARTASCCALKMWCRIAEAQNWYTKLRTPLSSTVCVRSQLVCQLCA